jgi:ribosomal protein S18 acetylase RimI-like enzyme
MQIRALVAADADAWRTLFTAYGVFYDTAFTDEVLDAVWAQLLTEGSGIDGLVADDGAVIGFAHYRSHPDTFSGGRDWFLDDLYVDPAARSNGVATALIAALTAKAREGGLGTLRWITAADNVRAQRVYDRIATRTSWLMYEVRD